MKRFDRITPEGTRDRLFEECYAARRAEEQLRQVFMNRGYEEVFTPTLEFYDVFAKNSSYFPQETMYKLSDGNGRLLVLRPDATTPIARLAATRLQDEPLPIRLCYHRSVFRADKVMSGRSDELIQSGVELIGAPSVRADIEVMATAVEALAKCGITNFRFEIGHVGFFNHLISKIQADDAVKEDIRAYIESKNYAALGDLLDTVGPSDAARALRLLPRLFGGAGVIDEAAKLFDDEETAGILATLSEVYGQLSQMGYGGNIILDLGLVNKNEYYTGVVFRGYIEGSGDAVLSGGRYDTLLGEFGAPAPAVGFGVNTDAVAQSILNAGVVRRNIPDILVFALDGYEMKAFRHSQQLIEQGSVVENYPMDGRENALLYAKRRGIRRLDVVGPTTEMIDVSEFDGKEAAK